MVRAMFRFIIQTISCLWKHRHKSNKSSTCNIELKLSYSSDLSLGEQSIDFNKIESSPEDKDEHESSHDSKENHG